MVNNLTGASVILSSLTKLIHEQVGLLKDIPNHADRRAMMKELGALMVQVGKVTAVLTDGIPRVMAAARLNAGQAGAITEHRHTGTVGVDVAVGLEADEDTTRRLNHMLSIHARAAAHVPGSYKGEETGIIDAEVTTDEPDVVDADTTALVPVDVGTPPTSPEQAEANLRRALAERGMPADRIEALITKLRARTENLGRSLAEVFEEALAHRAKPIS